ncbi:hypothetical protein [Cytobacillus oceanisediminis]|uniref:hypothetical protein n=1 Tax=Cytobacillus oceanisediminis TaxID=665099 RepID=UPI001FB54823|nr:hypothetical protein [Cytobacillus oceanisediminis]UOE53600.1 hypothetical protein IRB79_17205 [Cytobacillus oceanisediminis]
MEKLIKKLQPHCVKCGEPFWEEDIVHTDTMFEQIQHIECFIFKPEYIKETGTFGDIVREHQEYKKIFLVLRRGMALH